MEHREDGQAGNGLLWPGYVQHCDQVVKRGRIQRFWSGYARPLGKVLALLRVKGGFLVGHAGRNRNLARSYAWNSGVCGDPRSGKDPV